MGIGSAPGPVWLASLYKRQIWGHRHAHKENAMWRLGSGCHKTRNYQKLRSSVGSMGSQRVGQYLVNNKRGTWNRYFSHTQRECSSANALILDFQCQNEKTNFCCFGYLVCGTLLWRSSKLTHVIFWPCHLWLVSYSNNFLPDKVTLETLQHCGCFWKRTLWKLCVG